MTTKTPVPDRRLTESDWLVIQAARAAIEAADCWKHGVSIGECTDRLTEALREQRGAVELWEDDERFRESQEADERRMQRTGDTRI